MSRMSAPRIPLWLDLRNVPINKRLPLVKAATDVRVEHVLVSSGDPYVERRDLRPIEVDEQGRVHHERLDIGALLAMEDDAAQQRAAAEPGIVAIDGGTWTIIPLENLIAARRDRPGTLYAVARDLKEAKIFRDTLDVGVHGIILATTDVDALHAVDQFLRDRGPRPDDQPDEPLPPPSSEADPDFLQPATIVTIADAETGDRVCVDTTSMFCLGEGLLVGSTARSFALVHAETVQTEFVNARPFRVNAGAVHCYVLGADGRTQYLSEVRAGDRLLASDPQGRQRPVIVGRAKVERRPHVRIEWRTLRGDPGSIILQTAETIRLVAPDGSPIPVTQLKEGDVVLVHSEASARHFGMAIDEKLEEH